MHISIIALNSVPSLLCIIHCSIGVIFGFVSNQQISDGIGGLENAVDSAVQDGINYINDTANVSIKLEMSTLAHIAIL